MEDFGNAAFTRIDVEHVLWIPDATPTEHILAVPGCLDPDNIRVAFGLLWEHGATMPYVVVPPYRLKDMWGWEPLSHAFKPLPCDQWKYNETFRGTVFGCPVHCLLQMSRDHCLVYDPDGGKDPNFTSKIVICQ